MDQPRATIEVSDLGGARRWSFVDAHATANNLRARIGNFVAYDARGAQTSIERARNGDYESSTPCSAIRYEVDLGLPRDPASVAHVSWLTSERGMLMLYDLLPREITDVRLRLDVPANWKSFTTERERSGEFAIAAKNDAVFVIGRDLRFRATRIGDSELMFVSENVRAFGDDEAFDAVVGIYKQHRKVFRSLRRERILVAINSFPQPVPADHWRAETRGATLNYFAGRSPSRAQARARFTIAMTHEMLHLWVPNNLALEGAYDWFYEGFVEYQSLRACVRLGFVNHQELLDAVARAYDKRGASSLAKPLSLLAASRQRWEASSATVYGDGLLIAFLYDLTLRMKTSNRRSLDDVFRELLDDHARGTPMQDGNSAVVAALDSTLGSTAFTKRFVMSDHTLDLLGDIAGFGLGTDRVGTRTRIYVASVLTKQQHALHRELGRTY